jgi:putative SOS response-associated peptidase YedK
MCGRAAQSVSTVQAAAIALHTTMMDANDPHSSTATGSSFGRTVSTTICYKSNETNLDDIHTNGNTNRQLHSILDERADKFIRRIDVDYEDESRRDNYNMSPGMDAIVFWKSSSICTNADPIRFQMGRKTWGVLPRGGTAATPLSQGMGKHFNSLMFNARADTLYAKPTFAGLSNMGQSCIIAVDGFFEWKTELGLKQPYFVYRKGTECTGKHPYLLLAGLWKSVPTGWSEQPVLETFTIITTEVCESLKWLHSRMPVTIWDMKLAVAWLERPSSTIHCQLERAAQQTSPDKFQWHAVTPAMSSMKFRSIDATKPLPKQKTVKSFFRNTPTKGQKNKNGNRTPPDSTMNAISKKDTILVCSEYAEVIVTEKKRKSVQQTTADSSAMAKQGRLSSPHRKIDSFFKPKSSPKK